MQKKTNIKKVREITSKKFSDFLTYKIRDWNKTDLAVLIQLIDAKQRLKYFSTIKEYLSKEDYAFALKTTYLKTSGLNDPNAPIKLDELIKYFNAIDKKVLMGKDYDIYKKLPDEVTIYRGTNVKEYHDAISWTIDKKVAIWFYQKYESKGNVFKAKISKQYIMCYLNKDAGMDEDEVLVNPHYIRDIEPLEDEDMKVPIPYYIEEKCGGSKSINLDFAIQETLRIKEELFKQQGILINEESTKELLNSILSGEFYRLLEEAGLSTFF